METFPNEGKIDISLLDKDVIKKIENFIAPGRTDTTGNKKAKHSGISWDSTRYWYLINYDLGGKTEYTYEQISKFIENKNEFKKGDYIVTLQNSGACGKKNYCFKQRKDNYYIQPELDFDGDDNNGNISFKFKEMTNWRYATKQEIEHYNKINKPYDVTTIVSSELNHTNLQDGVIYYASYGKDVSYLFKTGMGFYLMLHHKSNGYGFTPCDFYTYQLATPEQIQHYEACLKAGKYVEPDTKIDDYWCIGSYVVALLNPSLCISSFNKGDIAIIVDSDNIKLLSDDSKWKCFSYNDGVDVKWFATKSEAELFAKTLVEVKSYDYEVVHCTTQEEWDFVRSKTITTYSKDWDDAIRNYKEKGICIQIDGNGWSGCDFYKDYNTRFYTFKEWCDMNNFTFESKPQFVKGKWYKKETYEFIIKYSHVDNNTIKYSDIIDSSKNYRFYEKGTSGVGSILASGWYELTDLSEIQQYLPKGHVDKVTTIPEYVELLKGWDNKNTGKIFKTSDRCPTENEHWEEHWTWEYLLATKEHKDFFKPSTKEAFEQQNTYVPQVGDWVVVLEGLSNDSINFANQCKKVKEISTSYIEVEGSITGLHNGISKYHPCEYRKAQSHEIPVIKPEHQLEVGKYYITSYGDQGWYIFIATESLENCTYINIDSRIFIESKGNFTSKNGFKVFQKASKEQIEWLDKCISANKFVPKESTKDELLEIAKSKYPVGTKFYVAHLDDDISDNIEKIPGNGTFEWENDNIIIYKINGSGSGKNWTRCIYYWGKWAEIVDKPNATSFTADFKWESKSPANTMAERMNINGTYGIMNGGNVCNEIVHTNALNTSSTTDEILRILNQYMEIEIPDTMEEVVLPQLLKSKSLITIK